MGQLSIILPVYNCQEFIKLCLSNIINSKLENYEIILVDDGSTDGSAQVCDELAAKYDEIRCVHQQNQGVSVARNHGLKLASGEYVVFFDVDDNIELEKLQDLRQVLEKDYTIDMVVYGLSFDYYYANQRYRRDELSPGLIGKVDASEWLQKMPELYHSNALSPIWNKIIKRSILVDNQLEFSRDMFLYEDLEFSLRCMACCKIVYFCSDIIYHYRQSEDEGNAGRRLKRIEHISTLIGQIEVAMNELIEKQGAEGQQEQIKSILLSLYLVLIRQKIFVSNAKEIRCICDDFIKWYQNNDIQIPKESQAFSNKLLNCRVNRLIMQRYYFNIRHKIAVNIKSNRIYRKIKSYSRKYGFYVL